MYKINTAWTSSHGQTTRPCQFGRIEARLTRVDTRPCLFNRLDHGLK
ncbi:hypothetical protein F383_35776 [Gossypium arboreum]|uniref:Uncharacterized protein n=1 Tax=Gossypium arboreum TaxID=29729 RepID=A0A0B0PRR0_GOSAR|nr:hypothetical protein F383_35776 [Gossypium arboreum]